MLRTDSEQFLRLECAAVTGRLPRDLGSWLVQRLAGEMAADERRIERDQHLRMAAGLIEGSTATKVRGIQHEAARLNRRPIIGICYDVPGLVAMAMQRNGGKLPGKRQLRRIIEE